MAEVGSIRVAYDWTPMSVGHGVKADAHTLVQIAPDFTPAPLVPAPITGLVIAQASHWSLGSGTLLRSNHSLLTVSAPPASS